MRSRIEKRLRSLDVKLDELFRKLDDEDSKILSIQPQNGGWNVLQVIEHLRMSESLSHKYILKKSKEMDLLPRKDLKVKWREFSLQFFLNSPFKFKAPAVVNEETFPVQLQYSHQKAQWKGSRIELFDWLMSQPDPYFRLQAYRHPFAGRMGIDGMLKFFNWHFVRHSKQIERTLKNVRNKDQ